MSAPEPNVARHLRAAAARLPGACAIAQQTRNGWREVSFAELEARSDAVARGLLAAGLRPGELALVMVRAGIELITLTYALFKSGVVPVLIDPGMGLRGFLRCVERTRPTALVGIPLAHAVSFLAPGAFGSVRTRVTVGRRLFWGGPTLAELERLGAAGAPPLHAPAAGSPAAILFTSGSTGPAKGVVYTHAHFDAQVRLLGATYGFREGDVDLAAFPLFSLFDNAFGMTSVIPDLDPSRPGSCDPARVAAAIRERGCTLAFGSPAIWRRVAPWCARNGVRLPTLKRVLIAGASVPPALIESLRAVIADEGGDVETPYGATESLPVANVRGAEILGETAALTRNGAGTCVGRVVDGMQARVIRIDDAPIAAWDESLVLPPGQVGEIAVKGPVVTRAYHQLPEPTAAAKIPDGDAVWHRMGDLGYFDEQGRLWFCGRKSERVETAGETWFTDRVEGLAAADPRVGRCALVGVGPRGAQRPVLVVEGRRDEALAADLRARTGVAAVLFRDALPVDVRHNAKIHRLQLAAWAEGRA